MILFRRRRPKKQKWPSGRRNPLKRLDSRKERGWILLPLAWIFLPQGLDFPSLRLGFSFLKAWIFLPPLRAQGELSGPRNSLNYNVNSTCVNAVEGGGRSDVDSIDDPA